MAYNLVPDVSPIANLLSRMGQERRAGEAQNALTQLVGQARGGDTNAINQLLVQNPKLGQFAMQEQAAQSQAMQKEQEEREALFASRMLGVPVEQRAAYIQQGVQQGLVDEEDFMEYQDILRGSVEQQNKAISDILKVGGYDKLLPENYGDTSDFLKEQRATSKETLKALRKRASDIQADYRKVEGLVNQMRKGSRAATSAGIMSVARLISPGVVTDRDAAAIAGAAEPAIAFAEFLRTKGKEQAANDVIRAFDPTNPKFFDVDGLLSIAKSVVAAESPVVLQQLEESKQQALRSGMNKRQFETLYGNVGSIEALGKFVSEDNRSAPSELPSGTKANSDGTFTLPDGTVIRKTLL